MSRVLKKRSKKAGLSPGALTYVGDKEDKKVRITIVHYNSRDYEEEDKTALNDCLGLVAADRITWVNINGLHRPEVMSQLGSCLKMHPLILEDLMNTDQQPKLEEGRDHLFVVIKMLDCHDAARNIQVEQLSLVLGPTYLITLHEQEADPFTPVRERLKNSQSRLRQSGPDYLAYCLLDVIVDRYFVILEQLGEAIETLEEEVVTNPTQKTLQSLHQLKRTLLIFRKAVWPLREIVSRLERRDSPLLREDTAPFFRDVYDHVFQVIDTIETFREMLAGLLDIYLSSISNRLNEIMKVLTIIATIFIPLTFVAGVYGMNFQYMPELRWRWGYFAVLFGMLLIAAVMLLYFRKKKWLGG